MDLCKRVFPSRDVARTCSLATKQQKRGCSLNHIPGMHMQHCSTPLCGETGRASLPAHTHSHRATLCGVVTSRTACNRNESTVAITCGHYPTRGCRGLPQRATTRA